MAFSCSHCSLVFFFNDTATTEIYTLSLHDALPILRHAVGPNEVGTGVDIKDAALCSLINFLPGGRGSREGIHRDGLQISDRDQILERVRVLPLVGPVLVQQVPDRKEIAHEDRFAGLYNGLLIGGHGHGHQDPHNRDDAHQLEEREAALTSPDTSSHPTRPPGWPRPGHTHHHRTRTTHREDLCSTVTASRPSRSAGPPGSSAGSV